MKPKLLRSLKTKMTLAVSLLVAILISFGAFLTIDHFESALKETISGQQFTLVSKIARDIDNHIEETRRIIVRIAASIPPDILSDADKVQVFFDKRLANVAATVFDNGIFLFGRDGRMIAEYPFKPGRRGRDYSFRDYFRKTIEENGPIVSAPYFSSQTHGHPAINFTAPIRDEEGEIVAVLAGSLDLTRDNFIGGLGQVPIGKTGYLYLYGQDRTIIMHPDPRRILQQDVPPGANRLFDRALEGFEGTAETVNSRGLHALASFKHLKAVDWILAANYPMEEAFAPVNRARENFHVALPVALVLSSVLVWLLMGYLIAPLLRITRHLQGMSNGRQARWQPLSVSGRDEIGELAGNINAMMTEIEMQRRRSREQLVFHRTLVDTIPNPVYYKDLRGRYLGCNLAFEQIHGLPRNELLGSTTLEVDPGADPLHRADLGLLEHLPNSFQVLELSLFYADGKPHDLILYQAVFNDADEQPAGLVGTLVDITQRKAIELALTENREFTENLLQNSAVPCFVLDLNHDVVTWTRACEELTGIPTAEVLGTDRQWQAFYSEPRPCLADLILDEALEKMVDLYEAFGTSPLVPEGLQAEGWFDDIGGRKRYLRFEAAPIRDTGGNLIAAIETLQDLTTLKQTEQALRESEANYRALVERSPDAIFVHRKRRIVFANRAAAELFGAGEQKKMAGSAVMDLVHPDFREVVLERISQVENLQETKPFIDMKLLRPDGTGFDAETGSNPVFHDGEWAVQTIVRDISERKELEKQVWRQANFDALTGIPNRHLFADRLRQALERAAREKYHVALFFVDLDRFKEVNDRLGHAAGDALLKQAAERLTDVLRKTDTVARIGGDEFTLIMPHIVEPPTVSGIARRVLDCLERPFDLPGGEGRISGSIGIAFFPEDGGDEETLVKSADAAMYRAKESGRNTFCFFTPGRVIRDPGPSEEGGREESPAKAKGLPEKDVQG